MSKLASGDIAMAAARFYVFTKAPYLSSAIWKLHFVPTPGLGKVKGDNFYRVYYDPDLLWSADELGTELIHIVWHLLYNHAQRAKSQGITDKNNLKTWKISTDLSLNPPTIREGGKYPKFIENKDGTKIPFKPVMPSDFKFKDSLLPEEYYKLLQEQQDQNDSSDDNNEENDSEGAGEGTGDGTGKSDEKKKQTGSGGCGSCSGGEPEDGDLGPPGSTGADGEETPGVSDVENQQIQQEVAHAIEDHSKTRGNIPGEWLRFASERLASYTDWRLEFRTAIMEAYNVKRGQVDYSYRYPNRRSGVSFGDTRVILPTMIKPQPKLGLLEDTSGSMSDTYISQCHAEIDKILASMNIDEITVICNDASAAAPQKVRKAAVIKDIGGGGTNLCVGVEAFMKMSPNERPDVLIILTDGYSPWEMKFPPKFKVITGIIGDYNGPLPSWSKVVRIKEPTHSR